MSVTTAAACAWTVNSEASWIAITSGNSGIGSAVVSYAVQANSGSGRTGTMTVAGRTFSIDQARPACILADIADFSRWTVQPGLSLGTTTVSGQQVELRVVAGQSQAGVVSPCPLRGDFDVQVNFTLTTWPTPNNYGLRLATRPQTFGVYRTGSGNYSVFLGSTHIASTTTGDIRGQFRLARTGAAISGFYADGSGWRRLGGADVGTDLMQFVLDISAANPTTPSELVIRFDNFRVNVGTAGN